MPKLTVKDLLDLKGKRQLTEVFVDIPNEARACESAGIDMIVTSEFKDTKAIRAAAPNTFLTIGLIYGRHANSDEAVRGGFKALVAAGDGQENHRRDHHLDQLDESIAQRLQRRAGVGPDRADKDAKRDGGEHLDVELAVEREACG